VLRRWKADLPVLVGYAAISFAYFGWRLWPHPGRVLIGYGHDPEIYVWSFAWWPHAIGSWMNPFDSHYLYAPTGVNLAWTLSVPGLALAFSPLTVLFGPAAAYNVAALLMPVLSAWTAYLLCRALTRSFWAAVIGGYLFGFSTFVLRQELFGNLPVSDLFLLPLVALVIVRYVRGELRARGLAWRLGLLLAAQLWLSTEFALSLTLALVLALLLAYAFVSELRQRLRSALAPIAGGYALGALFAAPLVAYVLLGFHAGSFIDQRYSGADLLDLVVPVPGIGLGGSTFTSLSKNFHSGGAGLYLGLPVLLMVAAFAVRGRRSPLVRFLVTALAVAILIVLGPHLQVNGHNLFPLPWNAATHIPVVSNALPFRFAAYVWLAAAATVALWIANTRGRVYVRPYLLPMLAVAALVPSVWRTSDASYVPAHPHRPAFFTAALYKHCIPRGETLAIFPFGFGGDSMVWQAETDFWFRLASDGLQAPTRYAKPLNSFDADPIVHDINFANLGRPTMDTLLAFAATHHVDRFLSTPGDGYPSRAQMRRFGPVERIGGMLIAPGCGEPSLRTRDLATYVVKYQQAARSNIGYCDGVNFYLVPASLYPTGPVADRRTANMIEGQGLTCLPPPAGYKRHGFATADMGVPPNLYPLYVR
jgi:hypothetical protein